MNPQHRLGLNKDAMDRLYARGVAAAKRDDFPIAIRLWRYLADEGHVKAQYNLGVAYARGIGVPQDSAEALKWWKLAAKQGHLEARCQANLLRMKSSGWRQTLARMIALLKRLMRRR